MEETCDELDSGTAQSTQSEQLTSINSELAVVSSQASLNAVNWNEESLVQLGTAAVQHVQSEQNIPNFGTGFNAATAHSAFLEEPEYIDSTGNERNTNVNQVYSVPSSEIEVVIDLGHKRWQRKQYAERLEKENRELKAKTLCYCCKEDTFSAVFGCGHTACEGCSSRQFCKCNQEVVVRNPCIPASSNHLYWQHEWNEDI